MLEMFAASALDSTHAKGLSNMYKTLEVFCSRAVIDPSVLVFFAIPVHRLLFHSVQQYLVKPDCYPKYYARKLRS